MEKFSITKLLDFSPLGFYKVFGLAIKIGMILLVLFGIVWAKNKLIPPKSTVENITVEEGGKVIINEQKRRLEYFIGGQASTGTKGDNRVGIFGGVKF